MHKLFIAIATGQNVANIPPIINLGQKGDEILWLVSKTALDKCWVDGSNQVLQKRGFNILDALIVGDDLMVQPSKLMKIFLDAISQKKLTNKEIVFVMTGGQKTAVMGIVFALTQNDFNFRLVYQDVKPVQLRVSDKKELKFNTQNITKYLSLNELLEVYNFSQKIDIHKVPIQLFPKYNLELDEEEKIAYQQYIEDPEVSFLLFQIYSRFSKDNNSNLKTKFPSPQYLYEQFQTPIKQWFCKSFYNIVYPFNKLKRGIDNIEQLKENICKIKNERKEKEVFKLMYKLFRDIVSKYQNDKVFFSMDKKMLQLLKIGGWIDDSCEKGVLKNDLKRRLGEFFEKMVAFRLIQFLSEHPEIQNIIAEIWLNYPVRRKADQQREFMEGDIFIVLKNATTLYLECKTFKITERDIFSKIERFRQVSGFVNKSYVVVPVFTTWPSESHEYAEVFNLLENLNRIGIEYIPFTGIYHTNIMRLNSRQLEIPNFADKLYRIFKPNLA